MNFSVCNPNSGATAKLQERTASNGVLLLDLDLSFPEPTVPQKVTVKWEFPCMDIYSIWSANIGFTRLLGPDWSKRTCRSRLACGAPFHALVSFAGENRMTVAVSDAMTPIEIATGVCEETADISCEVRFFTEPINQIRSYHATIFVDTRTVNYGEALKTADRFLAADCGYPSA